MMKKIVGVFILGIFLFSLLAVGVYAQVGNTVCCERTKSGAFCENAPVDECNPAYQSLPTNCESTSFCRVGTCFDSNEGICMGNTPQLVCNDNGGIWSEESPPQCELGCCILGDQAAFVSQVRCKKLSADLGIETNYDSSINSEVACIATVQAQDRGACVYEFEFERTCKFTTRAECEGSSDGSGGEIVNGEFFADKLCSAEELGTVCGPSSETRCVDGRDGVYFVDTCGNTANVYDASKVNNQAYWTDVIPVTESCGANSGDGNAQDPNCGNCNYLAGSFCRSEDVAGGNPSYGDFICADLNCYDTSNGNDYNHGESWCVNSDEGETEVGDNAVGSRFYKHICVNGEEVLEQCGDFREETCIESSIETSDGEFSQAACRVNRWHDCTQQYEEDDCVNTDVRDCLWVEGSEKLFVADDENGISPAARNAEGVCLPMNTPGLNFWDSAETEAVCELGNARCVVEYEEKLFSGGKDCVKNCHCLQDSWLDERAAICSALGDCGPGINWIGTEGRGKGYEKTVERG